MKRLQEGKRLYQALAVPEGLNGAVMEAFRHARRIKARSRGRLWTRAAVVASVCLCTAFAAVVNAFPALARELYDVPVLGYAARVVTFWRFEEQDEAVYIRVNMPALQNTGDTELERRINAEITRRVSERLTRAREEAALLYKAYLDTGGDPETYIPLEVTIDYDLKSSNEKWVSFVIESSETRANFYGEYAFYNIDMETGRELTLANLLGEDYLEVVNEAVRRGIAADEAANPGDLYFHDELAFETIRPDQGFYINQAGHVVVVFPKYEIAPGYMGVREFEILPP